MEKAKNILLIGASSGIGLDIARLYAHEDVNLSILCRTSQKAEATKQLLLKEKATVNITTFHCDLELQSEVNRVCEEILQKLEKIDVCIFNAATMMGQHELTAEGIEKQLAVNHLSSFIFCHKLLPLFKKSGECRLIFMSSRVFMMGDIEAKMLMDSTRYYHPTKAYADTKLLSVIFSNYLTAKLASDGVGVFTIHPGTVNTLIGNKHTTKFQGFLWNVMKLTARKPVDAAKDVFHLATEEGLKARTNTIWQNGKPKPLPHKITSEASIKKVLDFSYDLTSVEPLE